MPTLNKEGTFKVAGRAPTSLEEKESGAVLAVIKFTTTHELKGTQWVPFDGFHVYARQCIVKKDGKANKTGIECMKNVLGWDGDIDSIAENRMDTPEAQVVVRAETYNDTLSYNVQFINPAEYTGVPRGASKEQVSRLKAKYGAALRAEYGAKPVTPGGSPGKASNAKPGTPKASPRASAKAASKAPEPGTESPPASPTNGALVKSCTKDEAWEEFSKDYQKTTEESEYITGEWHRIKEVLFGEKPESTFTGADWWRMKTEGSAAVIPF